MPTSPPSAPDRVLLVLLDEANDREDRVIRDVALRAGLLQQCRCGWYNPAALQRCEVCRTRLIGEDVEPRTPAAIAAHGVLRYLVEAHRDGEAHFVTACVDGYCGEIPADVAQDVITDAQHFGYRDKHCIVAWEVIAEIEARAAAAGSGVIR
jgi:hypothetical protein